MNTFGKLFKISIFGESHGNSIGVLVDGVPAGIKLSSEDFSYDLARRKPQALGTTPRKEEDLPLIESGVFNGYTTGGAILIRFVNENVRSKDYDFVLDTPRPGHADYVAFKKYNGFNDYRGGGQFSGRITLGIVAAGVIAKKIIEGFKFETRIKTLHNSINFDEEINNALKNKDSIGGTIEVKVSNVLPCLGEPYFMSVESVISSLLYSVPAVKGVSFGIGFDGEALYGSQYNDSIISQDGKTQTNNNGGINGGITNGNDLIVNVFIKPTPSIFKEQETFNFKNKEVSTLKIEGRHDTCIALRAQVVCEACVAIALADLYLIRAAYERK